MAQVNWTARAVDRLEVIKEYISKSDPVAAMRVVDAIFARTERLKRFPRIALAKGWHWSKTETGQVDDSCLLDKNSLSIKLSHPLHCHRNLGISRIFAKLTGANHGVGVLLQLQLAKLRIELSEEASFDQVGQMRYPLVA
jgi:hypothetical protein